MLTRNLRVLEPAYSSEREDPAKTVSASEAPGGRMQDTSADEAGGYVVWCGGNGEPQILHESGSAPVFTSPLIS